MTRFLSICTLLLLFSCSKNDDDQTILPPEDYYQLNVGNYWVYDRYNVYPDGTEELLDRKDTVSVVGTTTLNNQVYFEFSGTQFGGDYQKLVRDSSGFLVEDNGKILFSTQIFNTVLRQDTIWTSDSPLVQSVYEMKPDEVLIDVPAGVFPCYEYEATVTSFETDPPFDVKYHSTFYSDDIGLVKQTGSYYSTSAFTLERRLSEFHIE